MCISPLAWLRGLLLTVLATSGPVHAQVQSPPPAAADAQAAALIDKHNSLRGQLTGSPYGRPLVLDSLQSASTVSGDVHAVLDAPFATVSRALQSPRVWCEIMILHINTKMCRITNTANTGSTAAIRLNIGKKDEQHIEDTFALDLAFQPVSSGANHLSTRLDGAKGPLGTSNYVIELAAAALPGGKTFLHLRYASSYGAASQLAMQAYLATVGRSKVGFSTVQQGQKAQLVGGLRGTAERNTMRYYLAIEAYFANLDKPAAQQFDARLQYWFDATESYARQLREMDRETYLTMKRKEYQRQSL